MPVGVEQASGDLWHAAPGILQQMRRHHMEPWSGRRARRALFGPVDREETRRFVKEELAAIRAADQQKYNFDFDNMSPLQPPAAGGYEWEAVAPGEVSAGYQFGRLTEALQQHRSARRLDFDAVRESAPESEPALRTAEDRRPSTQSASSSTDACSSPASTRDRRPAEAAGPPRPCVRQTTMTGMCQTLPRIGC